jgi:hypothetical protein
LVIGEFGDRSRAALGGIRFDPVAVDVIDVRFLELLGSIDRLRCTDQMVGVVESVKPG